MGEANVVKLPERLGLGAVQELHAQLTNMRGKPVKVDASDVTHFGTLCLQLLIAAARDHARAGSRLKLINVGDTALRQLSLFGLSPETIEGGGE